MNFFKILETRSVVPFTQGSTILFVSYLVVFINDFLFEIALVMCCLVKPFCFNISVNFNSCFTNSSGLQFGNIRCCRFLIIAGWGDNETPLSHINLSTLVF